jgi:proteasome lid subunit RPN8/RPN11
VVDGLNADDRLEIGSGVLSDLFATAGLGYPREACGILYGRIEGRIRVVEGFRPTANRWAGRDDRYEIDPDSLRRALEAEENGGPRIIGFYHSHPDALPVPSETDREMAWPWYHYLIVRVVAGQAEEARAWELEAESGRFAERSVSYT